MNVVAAGKKELLVNLQEIKNTLKPIGDLWDNQHGAGAADFTDRMSAFSSWHGYGWREEATDLVVSPFVNKPEDLPAIEARIAASLPPEVKVEGLVMPSFQEIGRGIPKELPDDAFQPGNVVIGSCPSAQPGTIGGFLTAERDHSTWLLSNRHVLAVCPSGQISGAHFTVLGSEVHSVRLRNKGNVVDAAVLKIENPSRVNPHFEDLGRVAQPNRQTMARLRKGTAVRKFGVVTKLTFGNLVLHCPKVKVEDEAGVAREFVHQLAIVSGGHKGLFADAGDSGSLIVNGEHPIGLLFASTMTSAIEIPEGQSLKPPFYLANRWDNVIKKLEKVIESPLKLMLEKKQATGAV